MNVQITAPRFAGSLYANGILFVMLGIPLVLAGVVVGFTVDFWWVLWVGLGVSGLGVFLWLVGSTAIAPVYGSLFWWSGILLGVVGLAVGLISGFWWLLWVGIVLFAAAQLAMLSVTFLVFLERRWRLN